MNIQLEKLFEIYQFSPKDRHEFLQIYTLLPDFKKIRVIESFAEIAQKLDILRSDLHLEQEILFGKTLESIESRLEGLHRAKILEGSQGQRTLLRQSF